MGDVGDGDWVALRDRALFTLLYGCGLRIDEALSLDMSGLPRDGFLIVMGKGRKERQVPVLPQIEAAIADYNAACPYAHEPARPLFVGEKNGKRLNQGVAQKAMRDLRPEAWAARYGNAPCFASLLCHPSPAKWRKFAGNTGIAGPCVPFHNPALHRYQCG